MASIKNLINWYKHNILLQKQIFKKDRIIVNSFWINWEKQALSSSRLKRVVKGRHWAIEDYYGIGGDFDIIVERVYKHFK